VWTSSCITPGCDQLRGRSAAAVTMPIFFVAIPGVGEFFEVFEGIEAMSGRWSRWRSVLFQGNSRPVRIEKGGDEDWDLVVRRSEREMPRPEVCLGDIRRCAVEFSNCNDSWKSPVQRWRRRLLHYRDWFLLVLENRRRGCSRRGRVVVVILRIVSGVGRPVASTRP